MYKTTKVKQQMLPFYVCTVLMLALLSIPSLLFFQFESVQNYFAINTELFYKDILCVRVVISHSENTKPLV